MATAAPSTPSAPADAETRSHDVDWTEKYRPRSLQHVVGNNKAVQTMQSWADSWRRDTPEKHALVLEGTPGIGKTSAAHALATDMGWDLIELNASDARSAPVIQRIAGQGATTNTFSADGGFRAASEGGRTLIVLDEADNLFERGGAAARSGESDLSDRGGKRAIVQTVRETRQPVILIVNDYYGLTKGSGAALRSLAETVKFQRVPARSVAKALAAICKAEGIQAAPEALLKLAENAAGDMRAAVNDLQATARGKTTLAVHDVVGGARDTGKGVFQAIPEVLKATDIDVARRATWDIDENPESFILWIDENLPLEYKDPGDLARGFTWLSKADIYLGRVRRRQYYGLWGYASELMTAGVASAKRRTYKGWTRYQFPTWLRSMSSSKGARGLRDGLAKKIGRHTHTSVRDARTTYLDTFSSLVSADDEFAVQMGADLRLTPDELALLLGTKPSTKKVKTLHGQIEEELDRRPKEHAGVWADDPETETAPDEAPAAPGKATGGTREKAPAKTKTASRTKTPDQTGPVEGADDANAESDGDDADEAKKPSKTLFDF